MDIIFFEYINKVSGESRCNKYFFFILYSLDSLMQHLLNDRCQVISGLSSGTSSRYINTVTNGACPIGRHQRDDLILDHLHTAVNLLSYTHLCYFIDFLLIQIQPDLFKLCRTCIRNFFTAHLHKRSQMRQGNTLSAVLGTCNLRNCLCCYIAGRGKLLGRSIPVSLITVPFCSMSSKFTRQQLCMCCAK